MQHEKWVFGLHISGHSWLRDAISRMQDKKMETGIHNQRNNTALAYPNGLLGI